VPIPKSNAADFWKHVEVGSVKKCWHWSLSLNESGYGRVTYRRRSWKAHQLAWVLTFGSRRGFFVLHKCDNPRCCNPHHLFLGTNKTNMQDSALKGRHPRNAGGYLPSGDQHHSKLRPEVVARGERNGAAVLNARRVREIRRLRKNGATLRALATQFGVVKGTINFIVKRRTWKHVE
jgi:hypothetical protein